MIDTPTRQALLALPPPAESSAADHPLELGLAAWVSALNATDPRHAIAVGVAFASAALPWAEHGALTNPDLKFGGPDRTWADTRYTPRQQLEALHTWLRDGAPLASDLADITRQLNVWHEDLRPPPSSAHVYFVEATNLLAIAALTATGVPLHGAPTPSRALSDSVVCSLKTGAAQPTPLEHRLDTLLDATRQFLAALEGPSAP